MAPSRSSGALLVVIALGWRTGRIARRAGIACLALYPAFVALVFLG